MTRSVDAILSIDGAGTAESSWQAWDVNTRFPPLTLPPPRRLVVVAPHPDDEVLGCGGLIATMSAAGVPTIVIAVTDGDASHPGSPTLTPQQLTHVRSLERAAALAELAPRGAAPIDVLRLSIPDGTVTSCIEQVTSAIAGELKFGDWCLATWRLDGHPDHEAVGSAAAAACAHTATQLIEFPIWTWHWATPNDPRVPWSAVRRIDLAPDVYAMKREAISRFHSQISPLSNDPADAAILPPGVIARLLRHTEVFLAS
jgi:LmbE family N-acetylglucosaminyl deacetylase